MSIQTDNARESTRNNDLWWIAAALGTTVGVAVLAYSRKPPSKWERTKQAAGRIAESATEINPWVPIGATAALGSAALTYRMRRPKSTWQKASNRYDELVSETSKQLRPWLGVIASATISAASAAYNAKTRRRAKNAVADRASDAAYRMADAGTRIWRRVQAISDETGRLYPRLRKLIA